MARSSIIAVHHTDTVDRDWDGPQTETRLGDDDERAFRREFAWVDASNMDAKTAHKFPHREVSANGKVGAANVRACINGISILNGGRGGANIAKADREGVYRHLAAHLRDAGREPAELD